MTFLLADLLASKCPNLWHALLAAGALRNGQIDVPDTVAHPLLAACQDAPQSKAVAPPATFTARLRTEAEKSPLRAICQACEYNHVGECHGSSCCGGQIPVEVRLNLSSTQCPRGRWAAIVLQPFCSPSTVTGI